MRQFDYIIVGAGAAGCVLAARLTEDAGTSVLLLEAGGPDRHPAFHIPAAFSKLFKTAHDWNFEAEGALPGQTQYWPRGKVLGGSDSINAMMYVRGHPSDYDQWAALGNPGWSWNDVLPYFQKAEHDESGLSETHGRGGPLNIAAQRSPSLLTLAFIEAGVACGIARNPDYNGAVQDGIGLTHVKQKRGRRWSVADGYLRPALRRPNLTVQTHAHVTRITLDGRRATGVEYLLRGTPAAASARREVILCGGAINSPQLLMLSGLGPADHLREHGIGVIADLPGVGQNLHDHPASGVGYHCPLPVTLATAERVHHLARYLAVRRGPLTSNVGEAVAFIRTRSDATAPDIELIFAPVFFLYHGFRSLKAHGFSIGAILLRPKSRGEIKLASADPLAAPIMRPNYFTQPGDMETMLAGVRFARDVAQADALRPFRGAELWPGADMTGDGDLRDYVLREFQSLYHPVGTCKMGADGDPLAVVDSELRVRGVDGLRVIDASVMPTLIGGHTVAATVMIAEKTADAMRGGR